MQTSVQNYNGTIKLEEVASKYECLIFDTSCENILSKPRGDHFRDALEVFQSKIRSMEFLREFFTSFSWSSCNSWSYGRIFKY